MKKLEANVLAAVKGGVILRNPWGSGEPNPPDPPDPIV